jgi:hypothetical protein
MQFSRAYLIMRITRATFILWSILIFGQVMDIAGNSERPYEYALVIDAGSSGSRIHVYKYSWDPNADPNRAFPNIELPDNKFKITPGLSSFAANPQVVIMLPNKDFDTLMPGNRMPEVR